MDSTAPQSALPVTLYTQLPEERPGVYTVGYLKSSAPGAKPVALLLDMNKGQFICAAECGCFVHLNLGAMVARLFQTTAEAGHAAANATTH